MLVLEDHWVWDFWFADDGERYHVFFLKAPTQLGDPDLRHTNARIGHAVSDDLHDWELLPDALEPGSAGAWDSQATWTGNVLEHEGHWYLFYSGIGQEHGQLIQAIGMAHSSDLITWERASDEPLVTPDPRWYETLDLDVWIEETCRDPWVFRDPDGDGFWMYHTARANHGDPDARGVIGVAWSADLVTWEPRPPLTEPGHFGHLEVPQLVEIGGRHYLFFSVYEWAHSAARQQRGQAVCGTHYLLGDGPFGPFRMLSDDFLIGSPEGPFYAGRLVRDRSGEWQFVSWAQFAPDGSFIGAIADPVPLVQHGDGQLSLGREPRVGDLHRTATPAGRRAPR